jgi:hypothetical protein
VEIKYYLVFSALLAFAPLIQGLGPDFLRVIKFIYRIVSSERKFTPFMYPILFIQECFYRPAQPFYMNTDYIEGLQW